MPAHLKIALINLASDKDNWEIMMVPLGLQYLSAAIKAALPGRTSIVIGDMGLIPRQTDPAPVVDAFFADLKPDVVGIRGFSNQADVYGLVAAAARRVRQDCLVVAGGPHAATRARHLYEDSNIDLVVPLEGEHTFVELVAAVLDGGSWRDIAGVEWWEDGGIGSSAPRPLIADLDSIPFPDYEGIDVSAYQQFKSMTGLRPKGRATSLFTTRGCYFRCTYCHDHFGKSVRQRSIENVLEEMEWLIRTQGISEFQIIDDIFNADRRRAIEFFRRVADRGWDLSISFPNGLRGDLITEEFVIAARAAGVYHWALAIESASPRIQKLVQKHNKLDRLRDAIDLSDQYGVFTSTFTMFGFPTESRAEMEMTVEYLLESRAHLALMFHVQPYEGTAIREQVATLTNGAMQGDFGFSSVTPEAGDWFTEVSPGEIRELIVSTYERFYFDAKRLRRMIDLTTTCHSKPALAEFIHFCMSERGWILPQIPDPEVRGIIGELLRHEGDVPYSRWQPPFDAARHFAGVETPTSS